MELKTLIAECTAYDFKVMLEAMNFVKSNTKRGWENLEMEGKKCIFAVFTKDGPINKN